MVQAPCFTREARVIIPILQMRKQTLKLVRDLALPLRATRWQDQDLNPGANSKPIL